MIATSKDGLTWNDRSPVVDHVNIVHPVRGQAVDQGRLQ